MLSSDPQPAVIAVSLLTIRVLDTQPVLLLSLNEIFRRRVTTMYCIKYCKGPALDVILLFSAACSTQMPLAGALHTASLRAISRSSACGGFFVNLETHWA